MEQMQKRFHWEGRAGLSVHGLSGILCNRCETGAISSTIEMAKAKVLLRNITLIGYLLVPLYLNLRYFGINCIFTHYPILYPIEVEKCSIRFSQPIEY